MGKLYLGGDFLGTGALTLGYGVSITGVSVAINAIICLKEAERIK
jgi:hypothetical protein